MSRRLLHMLAAIVVLVFGVQGVAFAQKAAAAPKEQPAKGDAARKQPRTEAKEKKAGEKKPVSRTVNGLKVYVDPDTGRLRQPTPDEARNLSQALQEFVSQSAEGLEIVQHPNGMMSVNLQDRFQDTAVAKVNADGSVALGCVSDVKGAEAFFKPVAAANGAARTDPAKKPAPRPANHADEKE